MIGYDLNVVTIFPSILFQKKIFPSISSTVTINQVVREPHTSSEFLFRSLWVSFSFLSTQYSRIQLKTIKVSEKMP